MESWPRPGPVDQLGPNVRIPGQAWGTNVGQDWGQDVGTRLGTGLGTGLGTDHGTGQGPTWTWDKKIILGLNFSIFFCLANVPARNLYKS